MAELKKNSNSTKTFFKFYLIYPKLLDMKYLYFIFTLTLFFSLNLMAEIKTVTISTLNWEPFISENYIDHGWSARVVEEAFAYSGRKVIWKFFPWVRAYQSAKQGKVDGVYPTFMNAEREKEFCMSNGHPGGVNVFIKMKSQNYTFNGDFHSLDKLRIGVGNGYSNGEDFDQVKFLNKIPANDDLTNLKKLLYDRIDVAVMDYFVFKELVSDDLKLEKGIKDLVPFGKPIQIENFHIAFHKNKNCKVLVNEFNSGLANLKKSNRFYQIISEHHFVLDSKYDSWKK